MYFLLNLGIFQCHVSFQGCKSVLNVGKYSSPIGHLGSQWGNLPGRTDTWLITMVVGFVPWRYGTPSKWPPFLACKWWVTNYLLSGMILQATFWCFKGSPEIQVCFQLNAVTKLRGLLAMPPKNLWKQLSAVTWWLSSEVLARFAGIDGSNG